MIYDKETGVSAYDPDTPGRALIKTLSAPTKDQQCQSCGYHAQWCACTYGVAKRAGKPRISKLRHLARKVWGDDGLGVRLTVFGAGGIGVMLLAGYFAGSKMTMVLSSFGMLPGVGLFALGEWVKEALKDYPD